MKKFINLLLISIILLSITAVTGANASNTAFSISGQVIDRYGDPLPGATVTLIDNNFNTIATKTTNQNGNFDFLNVVAETNTCTVRVSYTDSDGTKYDMPTYYVKWYPTSNIQYIPSSQTQIPNYPQPEYGYLYGAIQTGSDNSATFINGIVYLVSLDNDVKYYEFADRTDGKGSYTFYVPAGSYMLYAQHWENGVVYESTHKQVTVTRNADIANVLETRIILPLNTPSSNADPGVMPEHHTNTISGTVLTKDGKPVAGVTVTLLEKADNGSVYIPMKVTDGSIVKTTTDSNGNYTFNGAIPTTNDGKSIQAKKDIKVQVDYTDLSGAAQTITAANSDSRPLYYPDVILGYGVEDSARSITMPTVTVPYAKGGWVSLSSVPTGANIYVDGQQLFGPNNQPLATPCTAYIDAGTHTIKMSKDGYSDTSDTITMEANQQHPDFIMSLQKAVVPAWVTLVAAIVILLIAAIAIIALLATRIKSILAPVAKALGGFRHKMDGAKADREVARAHKAEAAKQEAVKRETARQESAPPVDVVNVDPVKRRHETIAADDGKKKKILDFDLKHIADGVPRKVKAREPIDAPKERTPVVFASDIYKKSSGNVERYETPARSNEPPARGYEQPRAQPVSEREALVERPTSPERNERFRIPRFPGQRGEASASSSDKERVLRYIRDHPEGVSFIQMSNDLEIIPNNLTYITKELVINDDIEKVKGLYYYKSHTSPADDSSSSVVVWRLDGDK